MIFRYLEERGKRKKRDALMLLASFESELFRWEQHDKVIFTHKGTDVQQFFLYGVSDNLIGLYGFRRRESDELYYFGAGDLSRLRLDNKLPWSFNLHHALREEEFKVNTKDIPESGVRDVVKTKQTSPLIIFFDIDHILSFHPTLIVTNVSLKNRVIGEDVNKTMQRYALMREIYDQLETEDKQQSETMEGI